MTNINLLLNEYNRSKWCCLTFLKGVDTFFSMLLFCWYTVIDCIVCRCKWRPENICFLEKEAEVSNKILKETAVLECVNAKIYAMLAHSARLHIQRFVLMLVFFLYTVIYSTIS